MFNVLIADNYPLSRVGIINELSKEIFNIKFVEADSEKQIFDLVKSNKFNLAIIAISQPGKTAAEIIKKLHQKLPKLPILVICIYPEVIFALRAIKMGASGYLTREGPINELIIAVNKIKKGGIYVSEKVLGNIVNNFNKGGQVQANINVLSNRELQVLQLLASGKSTKEISVEVSLGMSTISTYRSRIFSKLGIKTNADLTRFAIDNSIF